MDGYQKRISRLNESIQLKLSFYLVSTILMIALVAGVFSFLAAFDEAKELQDDTLRQIAAQFNRQQWLPSKMDMTRRADDGDDGEESARIIVQALNKGNGTTTIIEEGGLAVALSLPEHLSDGLHTLESNHHQYRVLVKTFAAGERMAVAQETDYRDGIAMDSALRTLMPFLILVPILLLIVTHLVRTMLRPIGVLSAEIDARGEQDLCHIEAKQLPTEVRPFVVAINRMLTRMQQAMEAQQRFVADAAHELRSPLTALSLQVERLAALPMSALAQQRLITVQQGLARNRHLLTQLLNLASARSLREWPTAPLSVQHLYHRVIEEVLPLAEEKNIDLGVVGNAEAHIWMNEMDAFSLVRNLVDNAIRYTPEGGKVDLAVSSEATQVTLIIQDSGPGINAAEISRIFDPFYRPLGHAQSGSGLGLSIVKAIADKVGAKIVLGGSDKDNGTGLCVRVMVPKRDAAT